MIHAAQLRCKQVLSALNQNSTNYYMVFIDVNPPTFLALLSKEKSKHLLQVPHMHIHFYGGLMRRMKHYHSYWLEGRQPRAAPT